MVRNATFDGIGSFHYSSSVLFHAFRFPNFVTFDGSERTFDGIGTFRIANKTHVVGKTFQLDARSLLRSISPWRQPP